MWNRLKSLGRPNLPNISLPTTIIQLHRVLPKIVQKNLLKLDEEHHHQDHYRSDGRFSLYRFGLLLLAGSQPLALSASPRNTSLMIWINMGPAALQPGSIGRFEYTVKYKLLDSTKLNQNSLSGHCIFYTKHKKLDFCCLISAKIGIISHFSHLRFISGLNELCEFISKFISIFTCYFWLERS